MAGIFEESEEECGCCMMQYRCCCNVSTAAFPEDTLQAPFNCGLLGLMCYPRFGCGEPLVAATKKSSCDVLIVGGGFCGWWFADKLKREHPELDVRLVEKTARCGGRLMSSDKNWELHNKTGKSTVRDELGGMRVFPSKMPNVVALLSRFKLQIMSLQLGDSDNIFYYQGVGSKKKDAKMPAGGKWAGQHPGAMAKAATAAYKSTPFWGQCNEEAYECAHLQSLSLSEFFKKYAGATPEEIRLWFTYYYHIWTYNPRFYSHQAMVRLLRVQPLPP